MLTQKGRLMILCHLAETKRYECEWKTLLEMRQPAVSQMLEPLREAERVTWLDAKEGLLYALGDGNTAWATELLYDQFCQSDT